GHDLSRAAAARTEGLDREQMGRERDEAARALFHHHPRRPQAARRGAAHVGAHGRDPEPPAGGGLTALHALLARFRGLVSRSRADAALDNDIQAHLEMLTRDYLQRGLSLRDAQAAARRAFGGVDQMKETYRDQRGLPAIETFLQDLRY